VGATCPHAIGDYYMTESTTAPGTRWPGTTWVALAGRVPVGVDAAQTEFDAVGKLGGSKALASHVHPYHLKYGLGNGTAGTDGTALTGNNSVLNTVAANYSAIPSQNTGTAGTGDSGNLQPFRVCHIWRRTA